MIKTLAANIISCYRQTLKQILMCIFKTKTYYTNDKLNDYKILVWASNEMKYILLKDYIKDHMKSLEHKQIKYKIFK